MGQPRSYQQHLLLGAQCSAPNYVNYARKQMFSAGFECFDHAIFLRMPKLQFAALWTLNLDVQTQ